jgi:hypothetical protein
MWLPELVVDSEGGEAPVLAVLPQRWYPGNQLHLPEHQPVLRISIIFLRIQIQSRISMRIPIHALTELKSLGKILEKLLSFREIS